MSRGKLLNIIFIAILIFVVSFSVVIVSKKINDRNITSKIDYIEVLSTGEKIYIESIETIEPTIWKGSYDGILYYKDGSKVGIDISHYGDFFGIKGEERGLFSKGVLYKYNIMNDYPNDFNFRLNYNIYGKYQIDTYEGTFTKDLIEDGIKTIDFAIPYSTKKDIYKIMMDINIMSFPENLKIDGIDITPPCDYNLTVTINGKTKNIIWEKGFHEQMTDNLPEDNVKFLRLVKYISDYIYNTDEYREMPKANGGYD